MDRARELLGTELAALVGESYERAYGDMVRVQQLTELEEVIRYSQLGADCELLFCCAKFQRYRVQYEASAGGHPPLPAGRRAPTVSCSSVQNHNVFVYSMRPQLTELQEVFRRSQVGVDCPQLGADCASPFSRAV